MTTKGKSKKTLFKDDKYQHLLAKELMETMLLEGNKLSNNAKEAISNAIDVCWSEFKKEQERSMSNPG